MITLQELCLFIDQFLDVSAFKDYCDNGLQVEGEAEIKYFATAVSANLQTIEKAVELGVQALIVHHGLFWKGDPYSVVGAKRKKLALLLESGISLLAYHLPLDGNKEVGNNWKAAKDLGLQNLAPFGAINGTFLGVKGTFSAIDRQKFQEKLEGYYQHFASAALGGKSSVQSAAIVSGGAYKLLLPAAKEGLDCFITGNFDEPAWNIAHEEKINFFAMGHTASETVGPKALGEYLKTAFSLKYTYIDTPNPF